MHNCFKVDNIEKEYNCISKIATKKFLAYQKNFVFCLSIARNPWAQYLMSLVLFFILDGHDLYLCNFFGIRSSSF